MYHAVTSAVALAAAALALLFLPGSGSDAGVAGSPYAATVLADAPSAYWRLGEASGTTAADEKNAAPGTYAGGVTLGTPGAVVGDANTAASFDGVDDSVSVADGAAVDVGPGDFSVEFWLKTSTNREQAVIGKASSWLVSVTDDAGSVGDVRARFSDGTVTRYAYSATRVDDGRWHHVVVELDRDSGVTIYVDGQPKSTAGAVPGSLDNSSALRIGTASGYASFQGSLDEVALYKTLLPASRISAHEDAGRPIVSLFPRPPCTLYASPGGGGSGDSQSSPTTLAGAYAKTVPGSTVCLLPGTFGLAEDFSISRGGSASAGYVTFRSLDPANPATLLGTAGHAALIQVNGPASYVQFEDLVLDGNNALVQNGLHIANEGSPSSHIRVIDSYIRRMGSGGIVTAPNIDYFVAYGNKIWRFGDGAGWSSGISLHNGNGAYWADTAPGFHNVIAGNMIAGGIDKSAYASDGNGIIADMGGNVPPTLIADNLVYMNGGRCIIEYQQSGVRYTINNTCYKNGLDTRKTWAEFMSTQSSNTTWVNNVASAARTNNTYSSVDGGSVSAIRDYGYGGAGASDVTGIVVADPLFVSPPTVDPNADQWQNPPRPETLGDSLKLQPSSPLVDGCADPRGLAGLDPTMLEQIRQFAMIDVERVSRPQGRGFDCGSYER